MFVIYQKVWYWFNDDWVYGNDFDVWFWDFQVEECVFCVNIECFNIWCYDWVYSNFDFLLVDNCLQSVLG